MYWPTESSAVPVEELGWVKSVYLATASARCDPTIIWGTTVQTESLSQFVADQRRESGLMISTTHVLIRAVVEALHRHPALNRRVVGRRIYPYDGVHITMPFMETRSGDVNIAYLRHAEQMSLADICREMWTKASNAAARSATELRRQRDGGSATNRMERWSTWLRLQWLYRMSWVGFVLTNRFRLPTLTLEEINGSSAFVNHLGFSGAPPMIGYKPSSLPTNSFGVSVTLGAPEKRPVVEENAVVVRSVAPLFVRVDHRLVNGYQTAEFVNTLRASLHKPDRLISPARES